MELGSAETITKMVYAHSNGHTECVSSRKYTTGRWGGRDKIGE